MSSAPSISALSGFERQTDVVLRDGSTVRVRPLRTDDGEALLAFYRGLSAESRRLRFFSAGYNLARAVKEALDLDCRDRYGIVAAVGTHERIIGHGDYMCGAGSSVAELGFAVADDFQGRGLGTILFAHVTEAAAANGITESEAEILPENHRVAKVIAGSGFPVRMHSEPGRVLMQWPTSATPEAIERFWRRDQVAASAAVRRFLQPRSVVVIGASRRRETAGGRVFRNLRAAGFAGRVFGVNPAAERVQGDRAYRSIAEIPEPAELAVIAVPAASAVQVARQCSSQGVRALIVLSVGFADAGEAGRSRQRELLEICRQGGMRLLGPNSLGALNTDPEVRLNATLAPRFPPPGRLGVLSQSGAIGLALIDYAWALGLGISSLVSVGNRADISANDVIEYWEQDEGTDAILLYLEYVGNPRRFARVARRVSRVKPILAVKSGRSAAGARATTSHTGALVAGSDIAVDALFRQAGIIRTDTLDELFGVAKLLRCEPPSGPRVAIVSNAGGPGIMCADACEKAGLEVGGLPEGVRAALAELLPPESSVTNPVDMLDTASPRHYRRTVEIISSAGAVDAIIAIFMAPFAGTAESVAEALRAAAHGIQGRPPILAVFLSGAGPPRSLLRPDTLVPAYHSPEAAACALARVVEYGRWRAQPQDPLTRFGDVRDGEVAAIIAAALAQHSGWLTAADTCAVLAGYGMTVPEWREATRPSDAALAAEWLGGEILLACLDGRRAPVRCQAPETERWARWLASDQMSQASELGYLVQGVPESGTKLLVGVTHDDLFGPVIACGTSGHAAESAASAAVRITPLTRRDARDMVRVLADRLPRVHAQPQSELELLALEELLLRVSALVEAHSSLCELDLDPVVVTRQSAVILHARARVKPVPPPRPWPALE